MTNSELLKEHFDEHSPDFIAYMSLVVGAMSDDTPDGYSEKHHVCPRSLGGSNSAKNLVRLKASDHYLAHLHLMNSAKTEEARGKMTLSFWLMHSRCKATSGRLGDEEWVRLSSESYAESREAFREIQMEKYKGKQINWRYTKEQQEEVARKISETKKSRNFKHSDETKALISEKNYARFKDVTNVPAYGKRWINDGLGTKVRIPKEDKTPLGWIDGVGKRKERSDKGVKHETPMSDETKQKISKAISKLRAEGRYDGINFHTPEGDEKIKLARAKQVMESRRKNDES